MEEKTEELRDIFLSVSEEETVTESQTEDRGSLLGGSDGDLTEVVEQLREKFGFELSMDEETRCRLIEAFYDGADDEQLAERFDLDAETVFEARMELHLLRDGEPQLPEETVEAIRGSERSAERLAEEFDTTAEEIRRCRAVLETRERSRRVSQRFRTAYEERLTDTELSDHLAAETHEDGLDGATEGAEVDVDF
ncbi:conditioned medium-induced protein 4 [Halovenus sp. WSH3]|uniref:Conditioned medium-induced protein 4 n=1 Tax=Halovenus carboxidivorans TaxID=2692199 RepID=A0A6B0SYV5_9EURY|nr:conditioned medium-induced protein 4 [Halovenus carboxidivorans]MXR50327.1 conditioned medium-induced protein 4 [Halovenus carboxidivorans]